MVFGAQLKNTYKRQESIGLACLVWGQETREFSPQTEQHSRAASGPHRLVTFAQQCQRKYLFGAGSYEGGIHVGMFTCSTLWRLLRLKLQLFCSATCDRSQLRHVGGPATSKMEVLSTEAPLHQVRTSLEGESTKQASKQPI